MTDSPVSFNATMKFESIAGSPGTSVEIESRTGDADQGIRAVRFYFDGAPLSPGEVRERVQKVLDGDLLDGAQLFSRRLLQLDDS